MLTNTKYDKVPVGILGGSFDPPHEGHLHISKIALQRLKLKKMLWVISPQNPFKKNAKTSDFSSRFEKCSKILSNSPKIEASRLEKDLFDKSNKSKNFYTYNFLKRLKNIHPEYELYFIIGADNLINFHKWYRYKDILSCCRLVVVDRQGYKYKAQRSRTGVSCDYIYINAKKINISSTEIRKSS